MSKIEAGKLELYEEVFDLADLAESVLRFVKIQAERGGVALKLSIAPSAAMIFADKRAVKQMLINLLTNGIKYTPRGGDVRVRAMRDGNGVEITVADSGVGISAKDLARLGKPFEQVEGEHVRSKEGTGLGLALVKALSLLHGGEALLESALGEGTTVRIRLPFAAVDEKGQALRAREAKIIPFKGAA
ncbi:MAG: HAMP domain-containing sensor histidine kinase [Rhizomicrobium sp.]